MTVAPTPSVRSGRSARHAIRALAIAAVAAITIAACSSGTADEPIAASSQEPNGSTATSLVTSGSERAAGSFGDVPVTFTVPDGWTNIGWAVVKGDPAFGLFFMEVGNTYTDSCPSVELDPPVGPTVDDLASVWRDLPAFDATVPTDVTVDGFAGKQVEFTVPDYDERDCAYGQFMLLRNPDDADGYWAQAPNQHHQLRILDVNGTRVVIGATWYPDTSAQDRADIDEILRSIQIG